MAKLRRWICVKCDKDFQEGDWYCYAGSPHEVESKTYYMDDAPHDKRDCKNSRLRMENVIPESSYVDASGVLRIVPGEGVLFVRGQYETNNPRLQKGLDERKTVSKERWEQVYFSDAEKLEMEKRRVSAERQRLIDEKNELLAQVKRLKTTKQQLEAEPVTK